MRGLVNLLLILTTSVADIFLFRIGVLPFEPSFSIILPLFVLIFFNRRYLQNYGIISGNVFVFFFGLIILGGLFSVISSSSEIGYTLGLYLMNSLLLVATTLYFSSCSYKDLYYIFFFALLLLGGSILSDIFLSQNLINRGAGFAENPNSAALRLNFILIALLLLVMKPIHKYILFGIVGTLIFFTLSRSGILLFAVILFMTQLTGYNGYISLPSMRRRFFKTLTFFIGTIMILGLFLSYLGSNIAAFQNRGALGRIEQLQGKSGLVAERDLGDDGRLSIANDYLDFFIDQPFGYGTAMNINRSFYQHSTHNTYLRIMIDFGIIGLVFLLYFIITGFKRGLSSRNMFYVLFFVVFALSCLFTNTILENRTFIITLSLIEVLRRKEKLWLEG